MELSRDLSRSLVESTARTARGYRPSTERACLVPAVRETVHGHRGRKLADPRSHR